MKCTECGAELALEDRFCGECGAPRPQGSPETGRRVLPRFTEAERRFAALRARYQAGELSEAAYDAGLERLVIEDDAGDHWVLGAESGEWYWYDGEQWVRRDPPAPEAKADSSSAKVTTPAEDLPKPTATVRWKWLLIGCGGLILLLIVACVVMLIISSWLQQFSPPPLATATAVKLPSIEAAASVVLPTMRVPASTAVDEEAAMQTAEPIIAPTLEPMPTPTLTPSPPFSVRPYDPERDADIHGLMSEFSFLYPEEPGISRWDATSPIDAPARIMTYWCAADQAALDDNWSQMAYRLQVDGFPIELSQLAEMDWEGGRSFCRGYIGVLTGWDDEGHSVEWTRTVAREINDGSDTYLAGEYVSRLDVEMVNALQDEFNDASEGWLEGDYESDRIWIEAGEYHVLMKEPQRIAQVAHREDRYADLYLSATARLVSEAAGEYGLVFRYQNPENTYYFRVSHDGRYRVGKRLEGEWIDLVEWTSSDTIHQDQSENEFSLICEGDSIAAFVNSEMVARVADDTFKDGYVGVMVGSFGQPNVHIAFDHFWVEALSTK